MKRTNYTLNSSFYIPGVDFGQLFPTSMLETAPGDSLSGKLTYKLISNPVEEEFMNGVHFDHFQFYVPYRLVWDQWPNFISDRVTSTGEQSEENSRADALPVLAVSTPQNLADLRDFMGPFFLNNAVRKVTIETVDWYLIPALQYLAYLKIRDNYFRPSGFDYAFANGQSTLQPILGGLLDYQDYNSLIRALMDPTTDIDPTIPNSLDISSQMGVDPDARSRVFMSSADYHRRMVDIEASESADITSATTADELRTAFAQDHFQRVRDYYGDKYTDYLRAAGVSVNPQLLDDPELLGRKSGYLKMNPQGSTYDDGTENTLGSMSGMYTLDLAASMKKSYASEHGLIISMAVIRLDLPLKNASLPLYKLNREDYWVPEFDSVQSAEREQALFSGSEGILDPGVFPIAGPKFLEYQTGTSVIAGWEDGSADSVANGVLPRGRFWQFPQMQIGSDTNLNHLNNLLALSIGNQFSAINTPEFADIRCKFSGHRLSSVASRQRPLF